MVFQQHLFPLNDLKESCYRGSIYSSFRLYIYIYSSQCALIKFHSVPIENSKQGSRAVPETKIKRVLMNSTQKTPNIDVTLGLISEFLFDWRRKSPTPGDGSFITRSGLRFPDKGLGIGRNPQQTPMTESRRRRGSFSAYDASHWVTFVLIQGSFRRSLSSKLTTVGSSFVAQTLSHVHRDKNSVRTFHGNEIEIKKSENLNDTSLLPTSVIRLSDRSLPIFSWHVCIIKDCNNSLQYPGKGFN